HRTKAQSWSGGPGRSMIRPCTPALVRSASRSRSGAAHAATVACAYSGTEIGNSAGEAPPIGSPAGLGAVLEGLDPPAGGGPCASPHPTTAPSRIAVVASAGMVGEAAGYLRAAVAAITGTSSGRTPRGADGPESMTATARPTRGSRRGTRTGGPWTGPGRGPTGPCPPETAPRCPDRGRPATRARPRTGPST